MNAKTEATRTPKGRGATAMTFEDVMDPPTVQDAQADARRNEA